MARNIENCNLPRNFLNDLTVKSSLFLEPINENEVIILISNLKNNCAPGSDGLTTKLIKQIHMYITKPLAHIINNSFKAGKIPHQWKISLVTPIFKAGDHSQLKNYRPISVINNFAKIFEQALKTRLMNFFNKHHVITKSQYGFLKNSNTENAILDFTMNTMKSLDKSTKCLGVFLDLAKAFDTVHHEILLNKLYKCGIRGMALNLLKDYLLHRNQSVKIGEKQSPCANITIGVPQGTVLGPLLFLVYINSISQINGFEGHIICYADDTAILFKGDNWDNVFRTAETSLKKISIWLSNNLLSLNVEKTKFITFSTTISDQPNSTKISIHKPSCQNENSCNCSKIEKVNSIKYLGIILDQHMRWTEHISYVKKKIRQLMHKFYILRDILSRKNLMILYNSLVESILNYCITTWGGTYNKHLYNLQTAQNTILKIILRKNKLFSTETLYDEIKLFNIRQLYTYRTLLWMHSNNDKFSAQRTKRTRSTENTLLQTPLFKKSHTQRFLLFFGPKLYNLLPPSLRNFKKIKKFKTALKHFMLQNLRIFEIF